MYTYDSTLVSDLYKDTYGVRPTVSYMVKWDNSTPSRKQQIWDDMILDLDSELLREKALQETAEFMFNRRLTKMSELGATNLIQAIKWIIESEEMSDTDLCYGAEYFCYHFGMNYSAKNRYPIQEAINQTQFEFV